MPNEEGQQQDEDGQPPPLPPQRQTKKKSYDDRTRKTPLKSRSMLSHAMVTAAVSGIERDVIRLTKDSVFLNGEDEEQQRRNIAVFHRREVKTGRLLGKGSFAHVCRVNSINLFQDPSSSLTSLGTFMNETAAGTGSVVVAGDGSDLSEEQHEQRRLVRDNLLDGKSKYAIKYLKRSLIKNPKGFVHAAADLVIESLFLSRLSHKHILQMHGTTYGGINAFKSGGYDSYFIITDRLQGGTLDQRIDEWKTRITDEIFDHFSDTKNYKDDDDDDLDDLTNSENNDTNNKKSMSPHSISEFTLQENKLLISKIDYSLQIGSAISYLHAKRIIFRDLKPQNIGFKDESHAIIQLFDFGLCRDLPKKLKKHTDDSCYKMSGAGTRSYMAPEIINTKMYNLKADIYSWAMVLYEMLALARPFSNHTVDSHALMVCNRGERPRIEDLKLPLPIPESIQELLQQSWHQDYTQRSSMEKINVVLQTLLKQQTDVYAQLVQERLAQLQLKDSSAHAKNSSNHDDLFESSEHSIVLELDDLPSGFRLTNLDDSKSLDGSYDSNKFEGGNSVSSIDFDTRGFFDNATTSTTSADDSLAILNFEASSNDDSTQNFDDA